MEKTKIAFAVLLLLSLTPSLFAQWNDTAPLEPFFDKGAPQNSPHRWYGIAMAAVGVCLFANILVYVLARVAHLQKWEKFAQAEFFQVTVSALLITNLIYLADSSFDYIQNSVLGQGSTSLCNGKQEEIYKYGSHGPLSVVQCKLNDKIQYGYKLYNQIYLTNKAVEAKASACFSILNVQAFCFDWIPYYHDTMEKAHTLAHQVVPMIIALVGQFLFLDYVAKNMFAVVLPLGIILRIFPPLRGIGGFLMALAIGFYVVFPLAYLMLDPTTVKADPRALFGVQMAAKVCFNSFAGFVSAMSDASVLPGTPTVNGPVPDMDSLGREMARLRVEVVFYPLAALGATVMFIQAAAPFFGGDSGEIVHFIAKVI